MRVGGHVLGAVHTTYILPTGAVCTVYISGILLTLYNIYLVYTAPTFKVLRLAMVPVIFAFYGPCNSKLPLPEVQSLKNL